MARKKKSESLSGTPSPVTAAGTARMSAVPDEAEEREEPVQQVVIIEKTGRVRRYGYTDFSESIHKGEKILHGGGRDFKGAMHFSPSIDQAVWRWKDGDFVKERELKRGEEVDWDE